MIKNFLFPSKIHESYASLGLLVMRVVFGALLMLHGWGKLNNFSAIAPGFMMGSFGLSLTIFAEFFCAMGVIVGLLYRLALIPMIINMAVAFFCVHKGAVSGENNGEMGLLYLAVFVGLFLTGAGKFAVDRMFASKDSKESIDSKDFT